MSRRRITSTLLAVALSAFAIAACGDTLSTGTSPLGDDLTADIGVTARDEVEAALSALTLPSSLDPIGTTPAPAGATAFSLIPCVTPSTPADSDGDGVPDDATYVFTAPPCEFTGWRGGTLDVVGQLRIQDPAPTSAGFGYDATLTDLRTRFTADDQAPYDVTRNGTRVLSGSISSLLLTADLQVKRTFLGKPDAAVDKQWTVTYTPATQLQINTPLPSGQLDIAGTMNWTRTLGVEEFVLTVTTPTPLHYNAGCTDTVQRIDGGELNAAGTFGELEGFVRVRWSGCGREPGFSFVSTE
jgi:hypothetical protein